MPDTILIVDDEEEFVQALSERLTLRDYKVTASLSGENAIEKLKGYNFDVVILDVQDDGIGFVAGAAGETAVSGGFGLVAMQERIERLGGKLIVESEPDEGTTVVVSIPVSREP